MLGGGGLVDRGSGIAFGNGGVEGQEGTEFVFEDEPAESSDSDGHFFRGVRGEGDEVTGLACLKPTVAGQADEVGGLHAKEQSSFRKNEARTHVATQ